MIHQEELREVFDGSCDLIPVGLISKECKALVEEFVPELVETLASEMNPDTYDFERSSPISSLL